MKIRTPRHFCDNCWRLRPEYELTWVQVHDQQGSINLHSCLDNDACMIAGDEHARQWAALRDSRIQYQEIIQVRKCT